MDFLCESKCLATHYCDMAHELTRIFDTFSQTHKKAHATHLLEVMMMVAVVLVARESIREI